jgi:LytTr DNA-binding domain
MTASLLGGPISMQENILSLESVPPAGGPAINTVWKGLVEKIARMQPEWRQRVLFYICVPILIAVVSSSRGSAFSPELPTWRLALMCITLGVPTWIVAGLLRTWVADLVHQPGAINVITVAVSGIVALVFNYFLLSAQLTLFGNFFYGFEALVNENGIGLVDSLGIYLVGPSAFYFLFFWAAANALQVILARHQSRTRVAGVVGEAKAEEKVTPKFFEKLNPRYRQGLVAVHAQEHYMLVITRFGSELIHYRFGEAIKELSQFCLGLQVHRSFWVSNEGVAEVSRTDRSYKLVLVTGHEVPVSHRYRAAFENSGIAFFHEAA